MSDNLQETTLNQPLTPNLAAKIFLDSFRHSQGDGKLQTTIFEYVSYRHPEWTLTEEIVDHIKRNSPTNFHKYMFPANESTRHHVATPLSEIQDTVNGELEMWSKVNKLQPPSLNFLASHIARKIIERDEKYFRLEGRQRNEITNNPNTDKFQSYFCYYGLNGETTGIQVLDSMYQDVINYVDINLKTKADPELAASIIYIITTYQKKHEKTQLSQKALDILALAKKVTGV